MPRIARRGLRIAPLAVAVGAALATPPAALSVIFWGGQSEVSAVGAQPGVPSVDALAGLGALAYQRVDQGQPRVRARVFSTAGATGSGGFATEEQPTPSGVRSVDPDIVVGSPISASVVYEQGAVGDTSVRVSQRVAAGQPWQLTTLSAAGVRAVDPRIDGGRIGRGTVAVWREQGANGFTVKLRRRGADGVWGPALELSGGGAGAPALWVAQNDVQGVVAVTWSRALPGGGLAIEVRRSSDDGVSFGPVETLSTLGNISVDPVVHTTPAGRTTVLWREAPLTAGVLQVRTATAAAGATFGSPVTLSPAGAATLSLALDGTDAGQVLATWGVVGQVGVSYRASAIGAFETASIPAALTTSTPAPVVRTGAAPLVFYGANVGGAPGVAMAVRTSASAWISGVGLMQRAGTPTAAQGDQLVLAAVTRPAGTPASDGGVAARRGVEGTGPTCFGRSPEVMTVDPPSVVRGTEGDDVIRSVPTWASPT
jgi:hypothetical protein